MFIISYYNAVKDLLMEECNMLCYALMGRSGKDI